MGGDVGFQNIGMDRFQDTGFGGIPEIAGVHGDEEVSRRSLSFGQDALDKGGFFSGDKVDFHACFRPIGLKMGAIRCSLRAE